MTHYVMENHRILKWCYMLPKGWFFVPGKGGSIFVGPFLFKANILSDLVTYLETVKKS